MCPRSFVGSWLVLFITIFGHSVRAISKGDFQTRISRWNLCSLDDLLVVSVATDQNDGYHRLLRSLDIYGYRYEVTIRERRSQIEEPGFYPIDLWSRGKVAGWWTEDRSSS